MTQFTPRKLLFFCCSSMQENSLKLSTFAVSNYFPFHAFQLGLQADHCTALQVFHGLIKSMGISVLTDLYLLLRTLSSLASRTSQASGFPPIPLLDPSFSFARSSSQHWAPWSSVPGHLLMLTLLVSSSIVSVITYIL